MKKGQKLENLIVIDGKLDKPRTINQVLGYTGLGEYNTMDENEYQGKISVMNKSDLNKEAISRGLIPIENRGMLERRLMTEFKRHVASFRPIDVVKENKINKSKNKMALDILSNGK